MKETNYKIGLNAEERAIDYITQKGYIILEKRYKTKFGEIDIIVADNKSIVFIEVKHRKKIELSYYAISEKSKQRIIDSANFYISQNHLDADLEYRFDAILLDNYNIEHIENIFS